MAGKKGASKNRMMKEILSSPGNKTMEKRIAAGGIVIRREGEKIKILLIKDSYGHWIWPKGHAENGETIEGTALREVMEETGLRDLEILAEVGCQEYTYRREETEIFKKVYVYLMETSQKELVIQTSEIEQGKWFSPEEALGIVGYEGAERILHDAVNKYKAGKNE